MLFFVIDCLSCYCISAEDVASSVAANLQQLNLHSDDQVAPPEEDNASVIIPNHLQVHGQDFSHLSFGSFGSGISSAFSGPFASRPSNNNQEETTEVVDTSSAALPDTRYFFFLMVLPSISCGLFIPNCNIFSIQKSRVLWG